ncbi:predicted protein [Verticillium alfalfae VaMs.102]|uniref:Predicted protein n=1 Tax=Verticillium alfalfae (strain VaMs.102 / ATCC MYA-4576 / FGSC 10136) TaxID=526221 RepID=C9S7C1_VERA1|nr:predicted protein [Verticillium alfalfae VaMs.102]EEY14706.1 predicted protein [Verticillium alfalfae VaMs.102]
MRPFPPSWRPSNSRAFPTSTAASVFPTATPSTSTFTTLLMIPRRSSFAPTPLVPRGVVSAQPAAPAVTMCEVFNRELFERKLRTLAASAPEGGKLIAYVTAKAFFDLQRGTQLHSVY